MIDIFSDLGIGGGKYGIGREIPVEYLDMAQPVFVEQIVDLAETQNGAQQNAVFVDGVRNRLFLVGNANIRVYNLQTKALITTVTVAAASCVYYDYVNGWLFYGVNNTSQVLNRMDFNGAVNGAGWTAPVFTSMTDVRPTGDGGCILLTNTNVYKLSSTGAQIWTTTATTVGAYGGGNMYAVELDNQGNVFIMMLDTSTTLAVCKLNSSGGVAVSKVGVPGTAYGIVMRLAADSAGDVWVWCPASDIRKYSGATLGLITSLGLVQGTGGGREIRVDSKDNIYVSIADDNTTIEKGFRKYTKNGVKIWQCDIGPTTSKTVRSLDFDRTMPIESRTIHALVADGSTYKLNKYKQTVKILK